MNNKKLVLERVEECFAIAERAFNRTFKRPHVRFDKRGTVAGTANSSRNELNFNETILNENVDHFVKQTVAHEVAHLVTDAVYGTIYTRTGRRVSHGSHWKSVMHILGVPADRCHNYDTSNAKVRTRRTVKYTYECTGCGERMKVGAVRHKNMQTGKRKYYHTGCRGANLVYVGA